MDMFYDCWLLVIVTGLALGLRSHSVLGLGLRLCFMITGYWLGLLG